VRAFKAVKVLTQEARQSEEVPLQSAESADRFAESAPPEDGASQCDPSSLSQGTVG